MKIVVNVSTKAIAAGHTPGLAQVDIDLQTLSAEDRALLAAAVDRLDKSDRYPNAFGLFATEPPCWRHEHHLTTVDAPTVAGVMDVLHRIETDRLAKEALRAEEHKAKLAEAHAKAATLLADFAAGKLPLSRQEEVVHKSETIRVDYFKYYLVDPTEIVLEALAHIDPTAPQRIRSAARAEADRLNAAEKARADKEIKRLTTEHDAKIAATTAARDAWLAANGGENILAKMKAGYNCATAVRNHALGYWIDMIKRAVPGLTECDPVSDDDKSRSCPSDAAFAAEQAVDRIAGCKARVVWSVWEEKTDDDTGEVTVEERKAETLLVTVACPWEPSQTDWGTIQFTGPGFAD